MSREKAGILGPDQKEQTNKQKTPPPSLPPKMGLDTAAPGQPPAHSYPLTAHVQQPGSFPALTSTNPSLGGSSQGVPLPGNRASPTWQLGPKAEPGGGAALLPWLACRAARVGLSSVEFYIFQLTFYFAYRRKLFTP